MLKVLYISVFLLQLSNIKKNMQIQLAADVVAELCMYNRPDFYTPEFSHFYMFHKKFFKEVVYKSCKTSLTKQRSDATQYSQRILQLKQISKFLTWEI